MGAVTRENADACVGWGVYEFGMNCVWCNSVCVGVGFVCVCACVSVLFISMFTECMLP